MKRVPSLPYIELATHVWAPGGMMRSPMLNRTIYENEVQWEQVQELVAPFGCGRTGVGEAVCTDRLWCGKLRKVEGLRGDVGEESSSVGTWRVLDQFMLLGVVQSGGSECH